jgi:hypothetical protein
MMPLYYGPAGRARHRRPSLHSSPLAVAVTASRHWWVVDSIEEGVAAVEVDGSVLMHVPRWLLPRGAKEGHVLSVEHELAANGERSVLTIRIDREATAKALRRSAEQLREDVRGRGDPGGDIVL